jgi:hypothetical protein
MLLSLLHIVDGSNATSLTIMIMQTIFINRSKTNIEFILTKLLSFGTNGINVF